MKCMVNKNIFMLRFFINCICDIVIIPPWAYVDLQLDVPILLFCLERLQSRFHWFFYLYLNKELLAMDMINLRLLLILLLLLFNILISRLFNSTLTVVDKTFHIAAVLIILYTIKDGLIWLWLIARRAIHSD